MKFYIAFWDLTEPANFIIIVKLRGVAKFGIALGSGPRGLGFESRYSDQINALNSTEFGAFFLFLTIFQLSLFHEVSKLYVLMSIDSNTERICYQWQASPRTKKTAR